jgi:hypothetical protein
MPKTTKVMALRGTCRPITGNVSVNVVTARIASATYASIAIENRDNLKLLTPCVKHNLVHRGGFEPP